ncbi:MAG TPA: restriction endonuclease [Kofleriaceae bacterium]|jgi:hypothetical protein
MSKSSDAEPTNAKKKAPAKKAPAKAPEKKAPAKKPAAKSEKKAPPKRAKSQKIEVIDDVVEAPETVGVSVETVDAADAVEDAVVLAETHVEEDLPELTDEERELSAMYGDDLNAPAKAHTEYSDNKTADEDRPMLPEINARQERKAHWQDRRDGRRRRRDERDRGRQERRDGRPNPNGQQQTQAPQGQGNGQNQQPRGDRPRIEDRPRQDGPRPEGDRPRFDGQNGQRQMQMQPPVQIDAGASDPLARVGTPLGDAAATVFAQLRNGQPLPVRQLAAMMRKRNLVESDPEALAPQLKAELLGDERSYRTLGLRPRIVYRGRDLFAPGPVAMSSTADAEAGIATALSRLAGATHRALAYRITRASGAGFERLIHAYLVAAGYREIQWVKRVEGIAYAQATAPGIERSVLISARSGDAPIDRRGIGELRVGVEAKNLVAGILFSGPELSEDAEKELERAGRSIHVICGDQLVATLIAAGVGVVSAAAPLHYVDDQLLDELLAG